MKLLRQIITLVCIVAAPVINAGEPLKYIPVASYVNSREMNETVGKRVHAILYAQKIQSVGAGSAGVTVSVPADRAAEALQLLAKAIKAENLQLTLLGPDNIITPDEVLEPKKAK